MTASLNSSLLPTQRIFLSASGPLKKLKQLLYKIKIKNPPSYLISPIPFSESAKMQCQISALDTVIYALGEALDGRPAPHPLRSDSLNHLAMALVTRFSQTLQVQDLDKAISLCTEASKMSHNDSKAKTDTRNHKPVECEDQDPSTMTSFALAILTEFQQSAPISSLNTAVLLHRNALLLRAAPHPKRWASLASLAAVLGTRARHTGELQDLDEVILLRREALRLQPNRSILLSSLSAALLTRFIQTGRLVDLRDARSLHDPPAVLNHGAEAVDGLLTLASDILKKFDQSGQVLHLDTAVSLFHRVLELLPASHSSRLGPLNNLANVLSMRFDRTGQVTDLDEAIGLHREALLLLPASHPFRSSSLNNLANVLNKRFDQTGQVIDLNEAIKVLREGLWLLPSSNPLRLTLNNNLANALSTQFDQSGQATDLNEAIELHREALRLLPASHPFRARSLSNLASAISRRSCLTGQLVDVDEAVSMCHAALELLPASDPGRLNTVNNLASSLNVRFDQTGQHVDMEEAISLYREVLNLLPAHHPRHPTSLQNLATSLMKRFHQTDQCADLLEAIALFRKALKLFPISNPNRSLTLKYLAQALLAQFRQTSQLADLDEAIALHREALELLPTSHPLRSWTLDNLAHALSIRFRRTGHVDLDLAISQHRDALGLQPSTPNMQSDQTGQHVDLDEPVALLRESLELRPAPHPDRSSSLESLASALIMRSNWTGLHVDVEEAILLYREALESRASSLPDRSDSLIGLANAISRRFGLTGQLASLEEAIVLYREVLELRPAPHPGQSESLNNLASAISTRFDRTGQLMDLEEAVVLFREALDLRPAPHPNRSNTLTDLATVLLKRFNHTGQRVDLEEGIKMHREALVAQQPATRYIQPFSLNNLGHALSTRFRQTGQRADLDEAVALHRTALELRPAPNANRPDSLNNLANVLSTRFEHTGQRADLDEAVILLREVIGLCPAPHPDRSSSVNNLASALFTRFNRTGYVVDLEEVIVSYHEVLELRPAPHPHRPDALHNLASALDTRSCHTGELVDVEMAIALHREALQLWPTLHPRRSGTLQNLAAALKTRFSQTGQLADLDEAIVFHREALELVPAPHIHRSYFLYNLATALSMRFKQTAQLDDLKEGISSHRDALEILPGGHPDIAMISGYLGKMLMDLYFQTKQSEHLDAAVSAFRAAVQCDSAPALNRLRAAREWANHTDGLHDSALEAYHTAIQFLPRLATLGLDLQSRQQMLSASSDGLARSAAACAIRSGQFDKAVELLEEGRAIFWSQALQLRTPLDDLRSVAPGLAQRLQDISRALEQGSLRDTSRSLSEAPSTVMLMEQKAMYYRRLNDDWLAALHEVRNLPGFQDFLRPKSLRTLQNSAANGPVVMLIASKAACTALVLTSSGAAHVPLPEFTLTTAVELVTLIRHVTTSVGEVPEAALIKMKAHIQQMKSHPDTSRSLDEDRHGKRVRDKTLEPDDIFRFALAKMWRSVVEPVVRFLNLEKSETPPRVWWCPTGPFAFLPIHAAGIYGTEVSESVSDYLVSSYTPTLSALLDHPRSTADHPKITVVIQPDTPGSPLPYTREELRKIENHVPRDYLIKLGTTNSSASVNNVLSHIQDVSILHLACHGVQDMTNPLESAFILEDGPLKVSQIMQQSMPRASLAFLSACQTAMGDKNAPDEAIHLAATMLFAGFRGAVATMWSMFDTDGPKIADSFYGHLFQTTPDTTEAARALHLAVLKLRLEKCSFVRWVPFIHLGL